MASISDIKGTLYLAADHRGFELKEALKRFLIAEGYEIEDAGAFAYHRDDDYVDFARIAAEKIAENPELRKGIFLCGSGHGMDMAANKFKGVRAATVFNAHVARQSREHEDANVLVLPADWLDEAAVKDIVSVWLGASFSGEDHHARRLKEIEEIEEKNFK